MTQQYIATTVVVLCLIALWLLSPTFRKFTFRLFIGKPNLTIEELPELVNGHDEFEINRDPPKKIPGATQSLQVKSRRVSIIYNATRKGGSLTETVDIAYPGKAGMIFTLTTGRMTCFERIGGITRNDPELTRVEENAVAQFMTDLRRLFVKPDPQTAQPH